MKLNQQKLAPYIFLSPFLLLFLVFGIYPIFYSIYISLFKWGAGGPQKFVGFANYSRFIKKDPFFWKSIWNSLVLLFWGSLIQHAFAIPLATLLNRAILKGREFFKTSFFIPYITNSVTVALVFGTLFNKDFGWLNYLLGLIGIDKIAWLRDPVALKASISIILNWRFIGYYTLIYLAGLQTIPKELYESAGIDGATRSQMFFKITLPMLVPIMFFCISISIIFGMQLFAEPFMLTGGYQSMGGAGNSGLTTFLYMMSMAFKMQRFGRASAVSWLMFLVIIILTLFYKKIMDKFDYTKDKK